VLKIQKIPYLDTNRNNFTYQKLCLAPNMSALALNSLVYYFDKNKAKKKANPNIIVIAKPQLIRINLEY